MQPAFSIYKLFLARALCILDLMEKALIIFIWAIP